MDNGSQLDTEAANSLVGDLLAIEPDEALLKRLRRAARHEDTWLLSCLSAIRPDQFRHEYLDDASDLLESHVRAYANGQRRKVRIRRNLPHRWILLNYLLLSDLVVPEGVGVTIGWMKPSITVYFEMHGRGATPDLNLESVLNCLLRQCGMNPGSPVRAFSAHSLPEGAAPDKLDPPRWSTNIVTFLEHFEIAIPLAGELPQIYRGARAKWGRRAAFRVYCRQLIRTIAHASGRP
jgi:hypothetical protein